MLDYHAWARNIIDKIEGMNKEKAEDFIADALEVSAKDFPYPMDALETMRKVLELANALGHNERRYIISVLISQDKDDTLIKN